MSVARMIALIALMAVFVVGVLVGRYKVFPYPVISGVLHTASNIVYGSKDYGPWSVCLYEGQSPFELAPAPGQTCPGLKGEDIQGMDARFAADPFLFASQGSEYLFYEVLNEATGLGEIAYATVAQNGDITHRDVVIREPFHMSYPQVFEWQGQRYMIPETYDDYSVRLYQAVDFPSKWALERTLISGIGFVDPTLFRDNDVWWMFVTTGENSVLNLYYSDTLHEGWTPHPDNPIVKGDRRIARSAGPVFRFENKLYRLAQDTQEYYGKQVFAIEIQTLTKSRYQESAALAKPVLAPSGGGWNRLGMHHLDLHQTADGWKAIVDGKRYN